MEWFDGPVVESQRRRLGRVRKYEYMSIHVGEKMSSYSE